MSDPSPTQFEIRGADWLSLDEAQSRIFEDVGRLPAELIDVGDSLGRALAENLKATATLPPWDNSAMDGYAVLGDDIAGASASTPVVLTVAGAVRAGEVPSTPVEPGQAVRIMTGAPVPAGSDTVVRV